MNTSLEVSNGTRGAVGARWITGVVKVVDIIGPLSLGRGL
jgi:hypothetical protein